MSPDLSSLSTGAATGSLFAGGDFTTIGGRSQQPYAELTPEER